MVNSSSGKSLIASRADGRRNPRAGCPIPSVALAAAKEMKFRRFMRVCREHQNAIVPGSILRFRLANLNVVKTRPLLILAAFVLSASLWARASPPAVSTLTVAAAANLSDVFKEVAAAFTADTGLKVTLSFGSTQQLTQQIENGAPFDVFAAADAEHINKLAGEGLLTAGTNMAYARGFLILWCPVTESVKTLDDLRTASIRFLAVAKPEAAPYGKAAVEALRKTGIWPAVEKKIVYGENITLTKQYVSSGNAECGFIAKSLLQGETKGMIAVDRNLYAPIRQSIAAIKASAQQKDAKRFIDFVQGPKGQQILAKWGYGPAA
jgi:molybdate transport system substrate-binding protein